MVGYVGTYQVWGDFDNSVGDVVDGDKEVGRILRICGSVVVLMDDTF